jgi:hypothetical protein
VFIPDPLQTTAVNLNGPSMSIPSRNRGEECLIRGSAFTLVPVSTGQNWDFQTPSANGWSTPAVYENADKEWPLFLVQLAQLASGGCFAKSWSVDAIQQRLVEVMPMPADQALLFYYSLGSYGFVDLHPGMQLGVDQQRFPQRKSWSFTASCSPSKTDRQQVFL